MTAENGQGPSEMPALALVAALRQEGDAWDVAGSHYLANLLHGSADEIERLRSALTLAERALRDYPMQSYRNVNAQQRRALAIDASRKALGHA